MVCITNDVTLGAKCRARTGWVLPPWRPPGSIMKMFEILVLIALYGLLILNIYENTTKIRHKVFFKIKKLFRPFFIKYGGKYVTRRTRGETERSIGESGQGSTEYRSEDTADNDSEKGRETKTPITPANRKRGETVERIEGERGKLR